jgi:uncharacterized membrane protein YgcG
MPLVQLLLLVLVLLMPLLLALLLLALRILLLDDNTLESHQESLLLCEMRLPFSRSSFWKAPSSDAPFLSCLVALSSNVRGSGKGSGSPTRGSRSGSPTCLGEKGSGSGGVPGRWPGHTLRW